MQSDDVSRSALVPQPRGPVLGWRSFAVATGASMPPHVMELGHSRLTTSGRAALWQALAGLALPEGSRVLVPTYHCPTLVAPVVALGLVPEFYGIDDLGLPRIDDLSELGRGAGAIIVPHYFGRAQSLAQVRQWCDEHSVALIEDCAHAFFGRAGERAIGAWGDFATASLTKFLPVAEAGVLASAVRPLPTLPTRSPGLRQQAKSFVDLMDRRPSGGPLRAFRRRARAPAQASSSAQAAAAAADAPGAIAAAILACDLERVDQEPTWLTRLLTRALPLAVSVKRRRENFDRYESSLVDLKGARALWVGREPDAVPYVFPLWVDDPELLYSDMRSAGLAVLRWDRLWPGTPPLRNDAGTHWRRHVLQLLCHQDLGPADVDRTISWLRARCAAGATRT